MAEEFSSRHQRHWSKPSLLFKSIPEHVHHYHMNDTQNSEDNSSHEEQRLQPSDSINAGQPFPQQDKHS